MVCYGLPYLLRSFKLPAFQDTDPLVGADGEFLVTGGDDGRVRLFNYPCVVQKAPNRHVFPTQGIQGGTACISVLQLFSCAGLS